MHVFLVSSIATILVSQSSAPITEGVCKEVQYFLDREWGFEYHRSDGSPAIRAVCARHVEGARARKFLSSLPALNQLRMESSTFHPGDIRSLARQCPSLSAIDIGGSYYHGPPTLEAVLWPELFEFKGLKHLTVKDLHCSGNEKQTSSGSTELETLVVSGNISGMLPVLLAPCKVRSLRIEVLAGRQKLTVADHAALDGHTEIESLEILGDVFGGGMYIDLNALSGLRKLRRLTLRWCFVDPLSLHHFPALRAVTLHGCRFIKHDFDTLLTHPTLKELTLWDYTNKDLRIAGPYTKQPKSLRSITLLSPVFTEIKTFHRLPCNYHVQVGYGGVCGVNNKANTIRYMGPDEIASLEKLQKLRSVSMIGAAGLGLKVNEAALVRMSRLNTLRKLDVVEAHLVQDATPVNREQNSGLEEVRFNFVTPLSREFVTSFLGANTRRVFVGPFSNKAQAASLRSNANHVSPRKVCFNEITFPVSPSGLEGRLLAQSVKHLVFDLCDINKGAIQQVVSRSPSLKKLTFDTCSVQDEQELLQLNELIDLKWIDFTNTTVSANTARAMKAESVWFGEWPQSRRPDR